MGTNKNNPSGASRQPSFGRRGTLPPDTDELLALAETVANNLADLGLETEASLRASMAAATFGINRYLAMLVHRDKSPTAASFLAEAKRRCDRSIEQLRRCVKRSINHLFRVTGDKTLGEKVDRPSLVCKDP